MTLRGVDCCSSRSLVVCDVDGKYAQPPSARFAVAGVQTDLRRGSRAAFHWDVHDGETRGVGFAANGDVLVGDGSACLLDLSGGSCFSG